MAGLIMVSDFVDRVSSELIRRFHVPRKQNPVYQELEDVMRELESIHHKIDEDRNAELSALASLDINTKFHDPTLSLLEVESGDEEIDIPLENLSRWLFAFCLSGQVTFQLSSSKKKIEELETLVLVPHTLRRIRYEPHTRLILVFISSTLIQSSGESK